MKQIHFVRTYLFNCGASSIVCVCVCACVRVHRNSRDTNSNLPYHRFSKIPFDVRKFNFKNLRHIENEIKPRCCMSISAGVCLCVQNFLFHSVQLSYPLAIQRWEVPCVVLRLRLSRHVIVQAVVVVARRFVCILFSHYNLWCLK